MAKAVMDTSVGEVPRGATDRTRPASVTEILPGRLFAISGWMPSSRRLSWIAPSVRGWIPLQCYVMRDGPEAIVIDTGAGAIAGDVREGLAYALEGTTRRTLWLTRREFDSATNMPWVVSEMKINSVKCGGEFQPLSFFASFDDANARAQIDAALPAVDKPESGLLRAGQTLAVGSLCLRVTKISLQVLRTFWYVETTTNTLFCSDSFSTLFCASPHEPLVRTAETARFTPEGMYDYLSGRFKWLQGAHTDAIADEVGDIIKQNSIQRLCPSWGCVIEGQEGVMLALDELKRALARLKNEPRVPVVTEEFLKSLGPV